MNTFDDPEHLPEIERERPRVTPKLPKEGSKEFEKRCDDALKKVAQKYAWTAQHQGVVLRRNPLKLPPHRDYVFNRIAKADYGFFYLARSGAKKLWYPNFEEVFGLTIEGEVDYGILVAERIEFLPGKDEVTHDEDGCRVFNPWQPPPWLGHDAAPPAPFLEHLVPRVTIR